MIDEDGVADWLHRYVEAWKSNQTEAIADLFSEDASYSYHPFDEAVRGREEIVASWLENRDEANTYDGDYHQVALRGDLAVVNGRSRYYSDSSRSALRDEYDNLFLLRFDGGARCMSFQEWWMRARRGPAATEDPPS